MDRLERENAKAGYMALITGALFEAVDRRFATDGPISEVIEFVGEVRSRSEGVANQVDPRVAELLIRHSLGDGSIDDIDDETVVHAQIVVLAGLIADERLDDAGLDEFLATARALGDHLVT